MTDGHVLYRGESFFIRDYQYYQGTEIKLHPLHEAVLDETKLGVGIIDTVAGQPFGWYADCGIVHREPK